MYDLFSASVSVKATQRVYIPFPDSPEATFEQRFKEINISTQLLKFYFMMKKYQTRMKSYTTPQIEVLRVRTTCHMLDTSFPGQHKPAENGGTVEEDPDGQNDAKSSFFFTEE